MTEESINLKEEIKRLNENFNNLLDSGRVKGFKPRKRLTRGNIKKNYTLVITIGENREIKFIKLPIDEGTIIHEKIPRIATTDYLLSYKGKPAVILPEWSTEPYSPTKEYDKDARDKLLAVGYRLLLNKMEQGKLKAKKQLSGAVIFAIIIALIVGGYLLFTAF